MFGCSEGRPYSFTLLDTSILKSTWVFYPNDILRRTLFPHCATLVCYFYILHHSAVDIKWKWKLILYNFWLFLWDCTQTKLFMISSIFIDFEISNSHLIRPLGSLAFFQSSKLISVKSKVASKYPYLVFPLWHNTHVIYFHALWRIIVWRVRLYLQF